MNAAGGFQMADLSAIARRRGRVVATTAGLITLASFWIAMALSNQYESYATVLVEPQAVDEQLVRAGIPQSDLNERLGLMTAQILSRSRLSRIIDELELYAEESEYMVREEVIDLFRSSVSIEPVLSELEASNPGRRRDQEINTFRIVFSDDSALVAMKVAARLANDFIEEHINARVKVSQKSLDFIQGELDRLAERIGAVESQVAKVKEANPGRLPEDMAATQRRHERLMTELALAHRQAAEARSDQAYFASQVGVGGGSSINDPASPSRRMQILELEAAEHQAKGFTDKHPDVIRNRVELDALRERIAAQGVADVDKPIDALQMRALADAKRAALKVAATEKEITRLEGIAEETQILLYETPAVAEQLDGLEKDYRHLFQSYQDYSNRQQEATVQAQLERRQLGEQFRVLETPFIAPAPSSPNRPVIVVLGLMFGLAVGGGLGILLESADPSVYTPRELQASLRIPVLASIPDILLESDRAARRRSRFKQVFATVAVLLFGLTGGVLNYMWVNGMPGFLQELTGQEGEGAPGTAEPTPTVVGQGG